MHEVTNSKLLNKEMEFKALQAQINPHFLYNALDTVNWMAMKKGDTEICDMVSAISNLMRISIGNKQDIFSIRQELKYVKDYLYIQETRYRDRFQVYFAIDEKILDEKIPKLTIQPLVENAIVHSVEVSKGKTVLNINGYIEQGNVVIEIKDEESEWIEIPCFICWIHRKGKKRIFLLLIRDLACMPFINVCAICMGKNTD